LLFDHKNIILSSRPGKNYITPLLAELWRKWRKRRKQTGGCKIKCTIQDLTPMAWWPLKCHWHLSTCVIKFTGAVEKTPFYFGRICQAISYRRVLF